MRAQPFDVYQMFFALRNHFTKEDYDYFVYGGKVRASEQAFIKSRDKFKFQKLTRIVSNTDMKNFLIANFLSGKKWVGEFLDDNAKDIYLQYQKRNQSLTYMFANELDYLLDQVDNVSDLFRIKEGQHPIILNLYIGNQVSIETMIMLDYFIQYYDKFDEKLKDDYIWDKHKLLLKKYKPFVDFDKKKIKSIMKEKLLDKNTI